MSRKGRVDAVRTRSISTAQLGMKEHDHETANTGLKCSPPHLGKNHNSKFYGLKTKPKMLLTNTDFWRTTNTAVF